MSITGYFHNSQFPLNTAESLTHKEFMQTMEKEAEKQKISITLFSTIFKAPTKTIKFNYKGYDFPITRNIKKTEISLGELMYMYAVTKTYAFKEEDEDEDEYTYNGVFEITYTPDLNVTFGEN